MVTCAVGKINRVWRQRISRDVISDSNFLEAEKALIAEGQGSGMEDWRRGKRVQARAGARWPGCGTFTGMLGGSLQAVGQTSPLPVHHSVSSLPLTNASSLPR